MSQTWQEAFDKAIVKCFGQTKAKNLINRYRKGFSLSYQEDNNPEIAVSDIKHIEELSDNHRLETFLYEKNGQIHLRLYQYQEPIALSDILPMLENMDLRTLAEQPYKLTFGNTTVWLSDFSLAYAKTTSINFSEIEDIFEDAFIHIQNGTCENDGFNRLVLNAQLPWREVSILRAYAKYLQQVGFRFSQPYIEKTLSYNSEIAKDLIYLFLTRFNPQAKENNCDQLETKIQTALENVTSLDDDRILRRIWNLIQATLRTNYFQLDSHKNFKPYLSFKLKSDDVPELPLPHPLYEIFVYSPRFEGIHLRSTKVSRGGIRWSDRREDFRTEILGLMKAQKVKNAVIVPSGAKGGFVLKALSATSDRASTQAEVVTCYQSFIRGLLDITDNYTQSGKITRPPKVICYDDEDPYLVVAADKGTSTFSDIANSISKEYQFWLGDAFASGGSAGYDHKKMGITARGAWESIKRHFREIDIQAEKAAITVVGIGDMSGDVFGNGLLYSANLKLVAAFDHRNIFIDPSPNPLSSFKERERLFNLPASSWEDYNTKLISAGGGVYKRTSKSIPISSQLKKLLLIEDNSLPPNELIRAILQAPVDLLFNGGIGTYVKATQESHTDVGDKSNEFTRIDGCQLRCRVVGEGGNLGFTQLGRIEYALQGGLINTDFVDNSAGVDCSDHEVNIKILLNKDLATGKITEKKRNALLVKMTAAVSNLVLQDNYNQALVMSFAGVMNAHDIGFYQSYITELKRLGELNRSVEFLPDDKALMERKATGVGLTRPELAVLMAYTKIHIKNEILKSDLADDDFFSSILATAFPALLSHLYPKEMQAHQLRQEIIATQLSNQVVNEMGIQFVQRLRTETGASLADIIRAETVASQVFRAPALQKMIESLDFKIPVALQYELLQHLRRLLTLSTRWFLRNNRMQAGMANTISHYKHHVDKLVKSVPKLMVGQTKQYLDSLSEKFINAGIPEEMAHTIAGSRALYTTLTVIEVATECKFDLIKTTNIYFNVGDFFNLVWFRDQINVDRREGDWNTLARLTLRDELDILQKELTIAIMKSKVKESNPEKLIEKWSITQPVLTERWHKLMEMLLGSTSIEYSMLFIALREFAELIHTHKI